MNPKDLERIEKKLDMIIDHFNIDPNRFPQKSSKEIKEFARGIVLNLERQRNGNKKSRRK